MSDCRSVQEREQDYSKARARIFGMQQNPDAGMTQSNSPQIHDSMRGMMNGGRPPNVGPMNGMGRGPPGRVDQGKKAVFRNREQDLQDPDYRRGYRCMKLLLPFVQVIFLLTQLSDSVLCEPRASVWWRHLNILAVLIHW